MNLNESYYLISESEIKDINTKISVLNRGIQIIENDVSKTVSATMLDYTKEIGKIINNTYKCNVIPQNKDNDK